MAPSFYVDLVQCFVNAPGLVGLVSCLVGITKWKSKQRKHKNHNNIECKLWINSNVSFGGCWIPFVSDSIQNSYWQTCVGLDGLMITTLLFVYDVVLQASSSGNLLANGKQQKWELSPWSLKPCFITWKDWNATPSWLVLLPHVEKFKYLRVLSEKSGRKSNRDVHRLT